MADAEKAPSRGFAVYFGSAKRPTQFAGGDAIRIGTVDDAAELPNNRAELTRPDALVEHHASANLWVYFAAFAPVLMVVENYLFHRRIFF